MIYDARIRLKDGEIAIVTVEAGDMLASRTQLAIQYGVNENDVYLPGEPILGDLRMNLHIINRLIAAGINPTEVQWAELTDQMHYSRSQSFREYTDEQLFELMYFSNEISEPRKVPMKGGVPYFVRGELPLALFCVLGVLLICCVGAFGGALLFLGIGAIGAAVFHRS
jgi:hypothetical protein